MKKSFIVLLGILITFLILGNIEIRASPSNWKYVFPLKIENPNSYPLYDRPFRIVINTKYLVDAGYLKSDLSDLRFTSDLKSPDEGGSIIPYWIEPGTENTENTIIWIKPSSLQPGTNYIYLWCGNPSATSQSNIDAIFVEKIGNLELFYRFEEGSGTTVYDYSGKGRDGTIYTGGNAPEPWGWVEGGLNLTGYYDNVASTNYKDGSVDSGYFWDWNSKGTWALVYYIKNPPSDAITCEIMTNFQTTHKFYITKTDNYALFKFDGDWKANGTGAWYIHKIKVSNYQNVIGIVKVVIFYDGNNINMTMFLPNGTVVSTQKTGYTENRRTQHKIFLAEWNDGTDVADGGSGYVIFYEVFATHSVLTNDQISKFFKYEVYGTFNYPGYVLLYNRTGDDPYLTTSIVESYFIIFRWDNGTYIESLPSSVTISYGGGSETTTQGFLIIDPDFVTSDYYTIQGSSFVRHYSTKFYTEAFIPEPDEEYTGVTIIINDYTGKFGGGWLKVYDSAQRLIQEEIIPLDYKVSCYLKLYETYKLVVEKDNEERVLGYVTIDQENKTITSYIGTTPPTYSEILEGVNYNVTDTGTSIMVTVTSEEPIDVQIKIYNQTGEEFSHSSSNVETVSITHTYSEKTFRTVEITVTDPETGESKKITYYVGTGVTQPFTLERTPNPLQLFNITFFSIPYEIRQLGLENILVYCTGIVIFLILCTKYTLGVGCIGAGITILFMKAWIGNVTYPDLIASVVIVLGGLYEFTRRR